MLHLDPTRTAVSQTVNEDIKKLSDSPHDFYLTGSRFFGGASPRSDWDFFAKDSAEVRSFLERAGFRRVQSEEYTDTQVVRVYRRRRIDIQLVVDEQVKLSAQRALLYHGDVGSREWDIAMMAIQYYRSL